MPLQASTAGLMVECLKLGKSYPPKVTALRGVSLKVAPGELLFITGNSGAGKSTLLKLLCRQETPDAGMVLVAGRDLARLGPAQLQTMRRQIGVAYQDFRLLDHLSVLRNIAMTMEIAYQPQRKIIKRVSELLTKLGLADQQQRLVSSLSRGEQQRVALARALANDPALVLADEPTGNLDENSSALVLALFHEITRAGGTVIVASHDSQLYNHQGCRRVHLENGALHSEKR